MTVVLFFIIITLRWCLFLLCQFYTLRPTNARASAHNYRFTDHRAQAYSHSRAAASRALSPLRACPNRASLLSLARLCSSLATRSPRRQTLVLDCRAARTRTSFVVLYGSDRTIRSISISCPPPLLRPSRSSCPSTSDLKSCCSSQARSKGATAASSSLHTAATARRTTSLLLCNAATASRRARSMSGLLIIRKYLRRLGPKAVERREITTVSGHAGAHGREPRAGSP
jgi:hypothetical protein